MKLLLMVFFGLSLSVPAMAKEKWVAVGDMYVPASSVVEPGEIGTRGFKQTRIRLWRNGILPYRFASNVSQSQRQLFLRSCAEMGEFANVQCVPKQAGDRDYLVVQDTTDNVCGSSYLGRYGGGQPLKIRCWRSRTIQHELMHALGVSHEHNRMDRDDHITIVWENISSSLQRAFRKVSTSGTSHLLSYYDYDSIMHYGSTSGSKNGRIVMYRTDLGPNQGYITQSNEMSYGDHYFLYALYGGEKP